MSEKLNYFSQLSAEGLKIISRTNPEKFPRVRASLNPLEEIAEGSFAVIAGALCMNFIYQGLVKTGELNPSSTLEKRAIYLGGFLDYTSMFFLGVYLHQLHNIPDAKWGPFN